MGLMDWIDRTVEKNKLKDWEKYKDQYDSEEQWKADRDYYLSHPEELQSSGKVGAHKGLGRSGPKQALVDLLSTDDLDALLHDCAPGLTNQANASYELNRETRERVKALQEKFDAMEKYQKLKGEHEELQKHYDELKKEYTELVQTLAKGNASSAER